MGSINLLGSEEQKLRWLPDMALLDKVGAFALTEPGEVFDLTLPLDQVAEVCAAMDERRAIKTLLRP